MRVCIHRGAHEVGGSCIEIEHEGTRLVLDVGLPLDVGRLEGSLFPAVRGLREGDPSILGLILSHGHPDHYGLVAEVHESVPRYLGEATQRILKEAAFFTGGGAQIAAAGHLADRIPIQLGPFTLTPYLVDHSAFDAYALLVEAGGRRLLYSGDLRAHGRKSALFERLLAEPPRDIGVLLLEGTNIQAVSVQDGLTERDVEERCVEVFSATEGMVLACYSPQNIDRLVTLFRAAKRSGRTLVMDLYAATMARATGRATMPQAHWDGVRTFVPLNQRIKVQQSQEFERVAWVRERRIFPEDLAKHAGQLVMTFRGSMAAELERAGCLEGAHAVWSMWRGYLDQPSGVRLRGWLAGRGIPLSVLHSSGHASPADLQRFAAAINAREVVPVHTRQATRYPVLFANVRERADGEWWTVQA
jgi:ribonuclease J